MHADHSNIAILFPGQGSQSLGMLADLAQRYPSILDTFKSASHYLGYDLWHLCQQGPEEKLNQTEFTQPVILAASMALLKILQAHLNTTPKVLAGHSLGEYSALVCAHSLSFEDALRLVQERGKLMQEACAPNTGAMAAIVGLSDEVMIQLCQEVSSQDNKVEIANFNATGQIVVAGNTSAVENLMVLAKTHQAKLTKRISVSVPAHSFLMKPASEKFAITLMQTDIHPPQIPILHNVTANFCQDPVQIRQLLIKQLYSPVRWTEIQKKIEALGITQAWEVGPGKVLCGLAKRTIPAVSCWPMNHLENLNQLR